MSPGPRLPVDAKVRLLAALVVGMSVGVGGGLVETAPLGVLFGIATTATVVVVLGWVAMWPLDAAETRASVDRQDLSHFVDELVVVGAALSGLGGIVVLLLGHDMADGSVSAGVVLLGVFMSWAELHLMYAARYAHLYYSPPVGGIDFDLDDPSYLPSFRDFLYFSYNLGMTYQVSDTGVTGPKLRSVVLRHCLLSYLFGAAILATTINLVVSAFAG